jgi:hypothetical protein
MDLLFPGCVSCAWLITRMGRGKASPATTGGSRRTGRGALDAAAANAPARRTPALPRLRGSPAALGRGVSPAHVSQPIRFAFRRQSGALSNYALKQTGAELGVVGLCAKHQVLKRGHRERNMGKSPAA